MKILFLMQDRWNWASLKMAARGNACWELLRRQPLILDTSDIEQGLMNSKNKVTEIREQRQEKWRDSKRQIKMDGWGVREVYGSWRDEAIKEKDEMVLFRFPFWEFLSLCEAARSLSRNCGPWLSVCLRLCTRREKKNREKKEKKKKSVKMSDAETFE